MYVQFLIYMWHSKEILYLSLTTEWHGSSSRCSLSKICIPTFTPHAAEGQCFKGVRLPTPNDISAFPLLKRRNPEVSDNSTKNHTSTENEKNYAVMACGNIPRSGTEMIVCRENLNENRAELSGTSAQSMTCTSVSCWKYLGGDHISCCVWACHG